MKLLDSSVIILFLDDVDGEEYLRQLSEIGENLIVLDSVYNEVVNNEQPDSTIKSKIEALISRGILGKIESLNGEKEDLIRRRYPTLGAGEINVLAYGENLHHQNINFWCVIDEKIGRRTAKNMGLPLTGSIGLIKILKKKKKLNKNKLKDIMAKIKESPFWIDEEILGGLLDE